MLTRTTHLLATGLLCLSFAFPAFAQLPSRGMSMDKVVNQYGEPLEKTRPVGDPPITRWVYDGFTVYFEGRYTLHAVKHRNAPANTPVPTRDDQPANTKQPDAPAPEPAAPAQPQFRFDPASGRVIEVGPDGKPMDAPTASPGSAPAPESKDAPAFDPATGQFRNSSPPKGAAETGKVERPAPPEPVETRPAPTTDAAPSFNPMTGQFEPAGEAPAEAQQPAQPEAEAPAPAPRKAPERQPPAETATPDEPQMNSPLRFNPTTGEFEPVGEEQPAAEPEAPAERPASQSEAAPKPKAEAAPRADEPETAAPQSSAPKSEPEPGNAENPEADTPAEGSEPRFRFDPTTGRIIMDSAPSPTAN